MLLEMQQEIEQLVMAPLLGASADELNVVGIDCEWRPENYYSKSMDNALDNFPASLFYSSAPGHKRKLLRRLWGRFFKRIGEGSSDGSSSSSVQSSGKKDKSKKVGSSPVLLLQISSRRTIWIVDLLQTCRQVAPGTGKAMLGAPLTRTEEILNAILGRVMKADNVLKVGMGVTQDLKRLGWSYPWMPNTQNFRSIIEIQTLAKKAYPGVAGRDLEGLSKLCVRQLGGGIDKKMQCSDWAVRPLSAAQLRYAGLDASVLVQLFDSLLAMVVRDVSSKSPSSSASLSLDVLAAAVQVHAYTIGFPKQAGQQGLGKRRRADANVEDAAAAVAQQAAADAEAIHLRDMVMHQLRDDRSWARA